MLAEVLDVSRLLRRRTSQQGRERRTEAREQDGADAELSERYISMSYTSHSWARSVKTHGDAQSPVKLGVGPRTRPLRVRRLAPGYPHRNPSERSAPLPLDPEQQRELGHVGEEVVRDHDRHPHVPRRETFAVREPLVDHPDEGQAGREHKRRQGDSCRERAGHPVVEVQPVVPRTGIRLSAHRCGERRNSGELCASRNLGQSDKSADGGKNQAGDRP